MSGFKSAAWVKYGKMRPAPLRWSPPVLLLAIDILRAVPLEFRSSSRSSEARGKKVGGAVRVNVPWIRSTTMSRKASPFVDGTLQYRYPRSHLNYATARPRAPEHSSTRTVQPVVKIPRNPSPRKLRRIQYSSRERHSPPEQARAPTRIAKPK